MPPSATHSCIRPRLCSPNAICKVGALSTHLGTWPQRLQDDLPRTWRKTQSAKLARESIGACRSEFAILLIVPSLHTCDRKKRFTVHRLREVGICLQLQLYRATACDAQWFSRCGLLLGPSPEHGRNHGWWRRVSCSAHFVTPWAQLTTIPT